MGLRPTTDGSANSDKYANDYMKETYPKQNQSVSKAPTTPPPQTSPAPPKSSSKSSAVSAPTHVKYYNIDHKENESPFFDSSVLKEIQEAATVGEKNSTLLKEISIDVAVGVSSNKMNKSITKQINAFGDILPNDVAKTALRNTDDLFKFGGPFLDFASQLIDGRDVDDTLMMTGFHLAVEWAVVLATVTFLSTSFSFGVATVIGLVIASVINTLIDYYLEPLF